MANADELLLKIQATGATQAANAVKTVNSAMSQNSSATQSAAASISMMQMPLFQMVSAMQSAVGALVSFGAAFAGFSGISVAANYQMMQQGFESITGSASEAADLMRQLREIGDTTRFPTEEVVSYAESLMATGSAAANVSSEITAMADAMSATGRSSADFHELVSMMGEMRFEQGADLQQIASLGRLGLNMSAIVGNALGMKGLSQFQAESVLARYRGSDIYKILVEGMHKTYGGAAQRMGTTTGIGAMTNLLDTARESMLSTGNALLVILVPLMNAIKILITWFTLLNDRLGGALGLIILLKLLVTGFTLTLSAIRKTRMAVSDFTMALMGLQTALEADTTAATADAGAAGTNAVAQGASATTGAVAVGGVALFSRLFGWLKNIAVVGWSKITGLFADGFVSGALNIFKLIGPLLVGAIVTWIGTWMEKSKNIHIHALGGILADMGRMASAGGLLGSFIPVIGTLAGEIAGAIIGLIAGIIGAIWDMFHHDPQKAKTDNAAAQTASNTAQTTKILRDIHAQMIGGGVRAQRSSQVSTTEIEIELARMNLSGMG